VQGPYFFYLDPHHTRPALPLHADARAYTPDDVDSCHTRRLRRLHIGEMDPSMLIGFLIRDAADWHDWRQRVTAAPGGKPIVHVADRAAAPPCGSSGADGGPDGYTEGGSGGGGAGSSLVDEVQILEDDDDDDEDVDVITISGSEI
jgi:cysteine protease ATG4